MLLNAKGEVFVARRSDVVPAAWQMPQGGIDRGESPREAVRRELAEEIGTAKAEIVAETPDWLRYDLPAALAAGSWGGRYRGQEHKWFVLRFTGRDEDIALDADHQAEFDDWRWLPIEALPELIVDFKRPVYRELVRRFRHLARPENPRRPRRHA